ncbi:LysR family transcriptional regulator [Klebsiella oxytoca]|uniref:LysR family transcriptional regulator n=1 Tax=Klebsiella oxytoca TaxID=571 RepID=A0A6B8MPD9_KLEOX|nr:LysR family transcriptional regulator [Klebsiella oxytoca]QGN38262.1 LysR family transcriptional regulator [Klebsiella oxytoca]
MFSDKISELKSQLISSRLPSLLALRSFEAAARLENFSRAADELHITHGAVSRAVRQLENELDVILFERRNRRVFLTDAGQTLARAVGEGLHIMQKAVNDLRVSARQRQRLILSCEPTLLMRWLIPRWPGFQTQYSGPEIHLAAGGGEFSFASGVDLAIRRDDFDWPDNYYAEPLFREKVGPVCRPDKISQWFISTESGLQLSQKAECLHTRTRPGAWTEWANAAGVKTINSSGQIFDHFYFSLQAAVAGLGVAIGSWYQVCDDLNSGVLAAPLGFKEDGSCYYLLSPQPFLPNSPQAGLLDWLLGLTKA